MSTFSQRQGLVPIRNEVQVASVDEHLRTELWNELAEHYLLPLSKTIQPVLEFVWTQVLHKAIDTLPSRYYYGKRYDAFRKEFFRCAWFHVYDIIETFPRMHRTRFESTTRKRNEAFKAACNEVLERNLSAYRFVGEYIVPVVAEHEIAAVEQALELPAPLTPGSLHIGQALELLAKKPSPDYRNSIKESISAVEAVCKLIANKPKATLEPALDEITRQGKVELHPSLKRSISALYGYANSVGGIRHALTGEPTVDAVDAEDARLMLVACSAFVNYLTEKAKKAGIQL